MAATASLPEPLVRGLRDIASLSEPEFEEFLTALRAIPVEIRQHRVFHDTRIASRPDNGESIKGAAFALILSRAQRRVPSSDAVAGIIEALTGLIDSQQLDVLRRRATAILSIESLDLVALAHNVLLEHSCPYSSARIISDIRPVFGEDVAAQPAAAVIVHMLNMIYYSAGRRESIAVALDEKDIDQLIAVLERARTKNKTLKETIEKSGLRYIGVA